MGVPYCEYSMVAILVVKATYIKLVRGLPTLLGNS